MAKIELQGVTKLYDDNAFPNMPLGWISSLLGRPTKSEEDRPAADDDAVLALDELTLTVRDGETLVIVGPSGCGKSTLLRVVAGLTDYTGLVTYDGRDMQEVPVGERRIGMVFQNYALYPHFYGQGNLRFFFQVNKAPDAEAAARIRATSEIMGFGFKELLKRKPGALSGGQQQRLAIARALVRQPQLFLLDEPLSNLDAKLRTRTRVEIKQLLHRFGITAIYVTHDQTEAMALGDRVAVMREGRIEQVGTFPEVLEHPQNIFVADFLGTPPMNLIQGTRSETHIVLDDQQRIPLPDRLAAHTSNNQQLTIGVRPEAAYHVAHYGSVAAPGASPSPSNVDLRLQGTIEIVEPDFGRRQQVAYINTGPFTCCVVAPLTTPLTIGYEATFAFPLTALHVFDTATGKRLT
jgi:ABC-type sugar transport system ATPase subunit